MAKSIIGEKFGKLTVEELAYLDKYKKMHYLCKCECGKEKVIRRSDLITGKTKSCGCLRAKTTGDRARTHGLSKSSLYSVWLDIKKKCLKPNSQDYRYYGGRGIKICPEWMEFMNFYNWAISAGYDHSLPRAERTIDRINTDGDYCPENCRFANMTVQNRNKHYKNKLYVPYLTQKGV